MNNGQPPVRLVAIVVTHNRLAHLRTCLNALVRVPKDQLEAVVVVDNASQDGTSDWLASLSDARIHHLCCKENLGGAGGYAEGLSFAQRRFLLDWVVLLDDDARPAMDALARFHAKPRDPDRAFAAVVLDQNDDVCALNRPFWNPFRDPWRFLRTLVFGKSAYYLSDRQILGPHPLSVDFTTFVGLFLSQKALQAVGLPDRRFFLYCDDLDYCTRLRWAGFQIELDPNLQFHHACLTFPKTTRIYDPIWKSFYAHRNGLIFARAAAGMLKAPVTAGLIAVWTLRCIFYSDPDRYLALLSCAIKDGLKGDLSRPHADVLRRAARGTGWHVAIKKRPKVVNIRQAKATKNTS